MSGDDTTTNLTSSTTENPLLRPSNPLVSDLEQEVLDEYTRLLENVNKVSLVILLPSSLLISLYS